MSTRVVIEPVAIYDKKNPSKELGQGWSASLYRDGHFIDVGEGASMIDAVLQLFSGIPSDNWETYFHLVIQRIGQRC